MKIVINKKPPIETYQIGQVIQVTSGNLKNLIGLLALVNVNQVCVICLSDGNRFMDPTRVKNTGKITKAEMSIIVDNSTFEVVEAELIIT